MVSDNIMPINAQHASLQMELIIEDIQLLLLYQLILHQHHLL